MRLLHDLGRLSWAYTRVDMFPNRLRFVFDIETGTVWLPFTACTNA